MPKKNKKKAKYSKHPDPQKIAKAHTENVESVAGRYIAWQYTTADKGGDWAWHKLSDPQLYKEVQEKLHLFEQYSRDQLPSTGSHPIPLDNLTSKAKKRLSDIQKDDIDELYSLRIQGKQRVWCLLANNIMKVLWWDPNHEVCPSKKKHT